MIILRCGCTSEYQDSKLGKGLRWHNKMKRDGYYRCTICGKDKVK